MLYEKTELHEERLDTVLRVLVASGARSVLDLGCGSGGLLRRLAATPQFERIVGMDRCSQSLWHAEQQSREACLASALAAGRVSTTVGSYTDRRPELCGFDGCAMVETIEHVDPGMLGGVEQTVFGFYRPATLVMTTPNAEYNEVFGLAPGQFREPDHRFEWDRERFEAWTSGVAERHGYRVTFDGIGEYDLMLGQPTQMAVFTRNP